MTRGDGKTTRPHPDEVLDLVRDAHPETPEEAFELNERVLEMTRPRLQLPSAPAPKVCSTCGEVATLQEARRCDGCDASADFGDPHDHPHFMCPAHGG